MAGELERRWNARLADVQQQEEELAGLTAARPEALSEAEHERLLALGADLEMAWTHPNATAQTPKGIVRAALEEVVVKLADDRIDLLLHWRGGDHTRLSVPRNGPGRHRWCADATVGDLILLSVTQETRCMTSLVTRQHATRARLVVRRQNCRREMHKLDTCLVVGA